MPRFVVAVCLGVAITAAPGLMQTRAHAQMQNAQQQRMKSCNAEAGQRSLNGSARQSFMSACLSGKLSQTTLMKVCNTQANQDKLASDARKAFVTSCLKRAE